MKSTIAFSVVAVALGFTSVRAADILDLSNEVEWSEQSSLNIHTPFSKWWHGSIAGVPQGPQAKGFTSNQQQIKTGNSLDNLLSTPKSKEPANAGFDLGDLLGESSVEPKESTGLDLGDLLGESDKKQDETQVDLGLDDLLGSLDTNENQAKKIAPAVVMESQNSVESDAVVGTQTIEPSVEETSPITPADSASDPTVTETTLDPAAEAQLPQKLLYEDEQVSVLWPQNLDPMQVIISTSGPFKLSQLFNLLRASDQLDIAIGKIMAPHLEDTLKVKIYNQSLPNVLRWISEVYKQPHSLRNRNLVL